MDRLELFWFARYVRPCMYPDASLQNGWASVNGKSSRLGQDQASRPVQARPACKFGLCTCTTGRGVGGNRPLGFACVPKPCMERNGSGMGKLALFSSVCRPRFRPPRPRLLALSACCLSARPREERREKRREKKTPTRDRSTHRLPPSVLCALCSHLPSPLLCTLHPAVQCSAVQFCVRVPPRDAPVVSGRSELPALHGSSQRPPPPSAATTTSDQRQRDLQPWPVRRKCTRTSP